MLCGGGVARAASPPTLALDGVHAVMLDAYTGCDVTDAWQTLNVDWTKYGSVPVSITTGGHLCTGGRFTLQDLEASGADTVILDSTAFAASLTPKEIRTLQTYAEQGHTLLGTDAVFQYKTKHNNDGLAPVFGLVEQPIWYVNGLGGESPVYRLKEQDRDAAVLLRDVPNPYISSLYGRGQKPAEKKWVAADLDGARYIAQTHGSSNAITVYDAPAYTAIYISSQAAFQSTPDDLQFLYNAIVYPNRA